MSISRRRDSRVIVVDTSVIVAFMNASDDAHGRVAAWLDEVDADLATTPLIVAEVDHLIGARGNPAALTALRSDLAAGAYLVEGRPGAIACAVKVAERYADTGLGLADASLVALAERVGTIEIATLDERHFRAVRPLAGGKAFRLLPADA
jgi:predicted nucleic acid-binding protein